MKARQFREAHMADDQDDIDNAIAVRAICEQFVEEMSDCAGLMRAVKSGDIGHFTPEAANRIIALNALDTTLGLLRVLSPSRDVDQPLLRLKEAVLTIQSGGSDPMLSPEKPDHRPPGEIAAERIKGAAVAAVEYFMKAGWSERKACKEVAKELRRLPLHQYGIKTRDKEGLDTGNTVRGWAQGIGYRTAKGKDVAAMRLDKLLNATFLPPDPIEAARFILKNCIRTTR